MAQLNLDSDLVRQCARTIGLTPAEVLAIAATGPRRYKTYDIAKKDGGRRTISQPSRELKALQYFFLRKILVGCPVHPSATAYVRNRSIADNASAHAGARVILKTDFSNFFPSIRTQDWRTFANGHFPGWSADDHRFSALVLFWGNTTVQPTCLSIGAPTSPAISNILMMEFDTRLQAYCDNNNMNYTRYADDITISSRAYLDSALTLDYVRTTLRKIQFPRIFINDRKTKLFSKKQSMHVTGLVLANDGSVSLGRDRKRVISSMVHRKTHNLLNEIETSKLRGLLAFASDVEPEFVSRLKVKYGAPGIDRIIKNSD